MMTREIQVSVSMGQSVKEGNLTIVFKFNSERNFGVGCVESIVKGRDSVLLDNHETVVNITFPDLWWD